MSQERLAGRAIIESVGIVLLANVNVNKILREIIDRSVSATPWISGRISQSL
jgi:hypothetical protein